jgi:hypothetical protein
MNFEQKAELNENSAAPGPSMAGVVSRFILAQFSHAQLNVLNALI